MMSYFDGMIAGLFRPEEATGRTIFFPNGVIGRGYVLPDAAAEQRVRRIMRWVMIGTLAMTVGGMQVLLAVFGQPMAWPWEPWAIAIAGLAVFTTIWSTIKRRLIAGLPVSDQRLTFSEAFTAQTLGLPRWYFYILALLGPLMMVGSIMWLFAAPSFMERVWAMAGLTLFTIATLQAFAGLRLKPDDSSSADRA